MIANTYGLTYRQIEMLCLLNDGKSYSTGVHGREERNYRERTLKTLIRRGLVTTIPVFAGRKIALTDDGAAFMVGMKGITYSNPAKENP